MTAVIIILSALALFCFGLWVCGRADVFMLNSSRRRSSFGADVERRYRYFRIVVIQWKKKRR